MGFFFVKVGGEDIDGVWFGLKNKFNGLVYEWNWSDDTKLQLNDVHI